jgi:hypothetical protein
LVPVEAAALVAFRIRSEYLQGYIASASRDYFSQLSSSRPARVGDLRVIFAVDDNQKSVGLLQVGHRERTYE